MAEQTGLKRTRKHIATLWSLMNGPGYALKCKCGQWEARGRHESRLREDHRAHRVEMGEWVKPRKEGPDWADLREMARNTGWSGRGGARWVMWGVWSGEDVADEHGWVIYHRFMESTQVTIVGPGTGHMTNRSHAELKDPAPARVLAVARELGLIGGTS